jgi:hypothetical protein
MAVLPDTAAGSSARLAHPGANLMAHVRSHALPAEDQRTADTWNAIIKEPVR